MSHKVRFLYIIVPIYNHQSKEYILIKINFWFQWQLKPCIFNMNFCHKAYYDEYIYLKLNRKYIFFSNKLNYLNLKLCKKSKMIFAKNVYLIYI